MGFRGHIAGLNIPSGASASPAAPTASTDW